MKSDYSDIINRLGSPLWWDEIGVPRYAEFSPHLLAFPGNNQAALIEIACQGCGQVFVVALSSSDEEFIEAAEKGLLQYGDPPVSDCCELGATMNSIPLRLLQFWEKRERDWKVREDLKGPLHCLWLEDSDDAANQRLDKSDRKESHAFIKKLEKMARKRQQTPQQKIFSRDQRRHHIN